MPGHWPEISHKYEDYLERYPEEGMVQRNDDDFPFRDAVRRGEDTTVANNLGPLEQECLITLRNDIPSISNLPVDDLANLPVGLTRILQIQRTPDHDAAWGEAAQLLTELNKDDQPLHDPLVNNIESMVRAVLGVSWGADIFNEYSWDKKAHQQYILNEAAVFARYMSYPTLEGIIKSLCRRDITMNGKVRHGRVVLRYDDIDHYAGGETCSHLGHLLWHLEEKVASESFRSQLEAYREAYAEFFEDVSPTRVYGDIKKNRNNVLHGTLRARAEFGMLLNLITLIIFNIDSLPEEHRVVR